MAFDPCDPCTCVPANIDDRLFHQMATVLLCDILSAIQGTGGIGENVNVAAWGGVATTLGQKAMAASVPVVIASDQSSFPVTIAAGTAVIGHVITDTGSTTAVSAVIPGVTDTSLGIAEDANLPSGRTLIPIAVQRVDVEGDTTTTTNDAATLHEYDGRLSVTGRDRLTTGTIDMTSTSSTAAALCDGMSQVSVYFTRTTETGLVIFQASVDGTTWIQLEAKAPTANDPSGMVEPLSTGAVIANVTNNYIYLIPCAGYRNFRIKVQTAGTGAALPYTIVGSVGTNQIAVNSIFPGSQALQLGKIQGGTVTAGDLGVALMAQATTSASLAGPGNTKYGPLTMNNGKGSLLTSVVPTGFSTDPMRGSQAGWNAGDGLAMAGVVRQTILSDLSGGTLQTTPLQVNASGGLYVDTALATTLTETTPTITNNTSTTILSSNTSRRYCMVKNMSGANIMISLTGQTLTGIAPTATNIGMVLVDKEIYESPPNFCPTGSITAYQSSGGTINTVYVSTASR